MASPNAEILFLATAAAIFSRTRKFNRIILENTFHDTYWTWVFCKTNKLHVAYLWCK